MTPTPPQPQAAAQVALEVPLRYARAGSSLAHAALAGARQFIELAHHPKADVRDAAAGTQFYYHAHRHGGGEHGHFHLFARGPEGAGDFVHLAALSLSAQGLPLQWFTTNQWVTGEHWAPATAVQARLASFRVATPGRLAPVARWLTAMVQLFQPQLHRLLQDRDQALSHLQQQHPDLSPQTLRQDRRFDILSATSAELAPLFIAPPQGEQP